MMFCHGKKWSLFGFCSRLLNAYLATTGGVFIIFMILAAKINLSSILQYGYKTYGLDLFFCFKVKQVLFVCYPTLRNSYYKPVYI